MKKIMAFSLGVTVLASACASMTHRGVVAMKINEREAHIGAGKGELSVGDHVELYRNICRAANRNSDSSPGCTKTTMGHGVVTSILNDDYSVVQFEKGVSFSEGDMIEKHSH
jgi:hypothetical protein